MVLAQVLRWELERSGATALEIGKMQRWRWEELICGDLKVAGSQTIK